MIVVSDSSPLIALLRTGHIELLQNLFGTVVLPDAVVREVADEGRLRTPLLREVYPWLEQRRVENESLVSTLLVDLDPGQAEAIALALELGADLIMLDESRGRERAESLGLRYTGTVGVVVQAKQHGLLPLIKPMLDALRDAGFWLGDDVYQSALEMAGE